MTVELNKKTGDWIRIIKSRKSKLTIKDLDINFEDYFIYKMSNKFRRASIEEFKEMVQSGYIFFRKDKFYDKEIDEWIEFIYENKIDCGRANYFNKPFPSQYVKQKIRLIGIKKK